MPPRAERRGQFLEILASVPGTAWVDFVYLDQRAISPAGEVLDRPASSHTIAGAPTENLHGCSLPGW